MANPTPGADPPSWGFCYPKGGNHDDLRIDADQRPAGVAGVNGGPVLDDAREVDAITPYAATLANR